jgi:hypothetical protein
MGTSHTTAARLHFILARKAHVAVIFRRGPTNLVQIIKWNTDTDTFEPGQWFKGRIFEDRSDISPDGTKLLYFAEKITPVTLKDPSYTTHWTAVSKLPYLTALALWPNGDRTCENKFPSAKYLFGGGVFLSDSEVCLSIGNSDRAPHPKHVPQGLTVRTVRDSPAWLGYPQTSMDSWTDEQFHRYLESLDQIISRCETDRHGWQYVPANYTAFGRLFKERVASNEAIDRRWLREAIDSAKDLPPIAQVENPNMQTLRKECTAQPGMALIRTMAGDNVHNLKVTTPAGNDFGIAGAAWADWDQSGRLVYVRDGKVFAGVVAGGGIAEHELADFTANKFEPIDSPEWAKSW